MEKHFWDTLKLCSQECLGILHDTALHPYPKGSALLCGVKIYFKTGFMVAEGISI